MIMRQCGEIICKPGASFFAAGFQLSHRLRRGGCSRESVKDVPKHDVSQVSKLESAKPGAPAEARLIDWFYRPDFSRALEKKLDGERAEGGWVGFEVSHPSDKNKNVLPDPEGAPAPRWDTQVQ
jgi:hypothetical protein